MTIKIRYNFFEFLLFCIIIGYVYGRINNVILSLPIKMIPLSYMETIIIVLGNGILPSLIFLSCIHFYNTAWDWINMVVAFDLCFNLQLIGMFLSIVWFGCWLQLESLNLIKHMFLYHDLLFGKKFLFNLTIAF